MIRGLGGRLSQGIRRDLPVGFADKVKRLIVVRRYRLTIMTLSPRKAISLGKIPTRLDQQGGHSQNSESEHNARQDPLPHRELELHNKGHRDKHDPEVSGDINYCASPEYSVNAYAVPLILIVPRVPEVFDGRTAKEYGEIKGDTGRNDESRSESHQPASQENVAEEAVIEEQK